ncbi:MAG TPA: hypothetical protein VHZ76_03075 [Gammaproteobacteria bacterium]|jgi:predicted metal-dependent enzyme (double-stranded beta helix superfamily)|nr:hypothetical protein [Gammaproteobacteria bacterium]
MLAPFYQSIEQTLTQDQPLATQLQTLRDLLKKALTSDDFRLACIQQILSTLHSHTHSSPWNAPPIFYHEHLRFSVRIIFWPAFYDNNPHQHKTWSITGVLHNQLDIYTYTLLNNPNRLKKQRNINAVTGEVGYLLPGCIHHVGNPSHELSASIHIFNNLADIENSEENAIWYPAPRKHNLTKGLIARALTVCLAIAAGVKSETSLAIMRQIYDNATVPMKWQAIQAMCAVGQLD